MQKLPILKSKGPWKKGKKTPTALSVWGQKTIDHMIANPEKYINKDSAPIGLMAGDQPLINHVFNELKKG